MLKRSTFIKKEYLRLLFGILLFYAITVIGEFVDSAIAGQFLGEAAVSAVEIIASITFFYGGVALLVSVGFQIIHSREMGKFNEDKACEVFWLAIIVSIALGIILFVGTLTLEDSFLKLSGCEGQLFNDAKEYYTYFPWVGLIYSLGYVIAYLGINDGNSKMLIISSGGYVLSNTILSYLFAQTMGMGLEGLSLGTLVATIIQLLLLSLHFLSKTNSIHKLKINIKFHEIFDMLHYGFFGFVGYVCIFVVDIVLHAFIISNYGDNYLAAYLIVNLFLDAVVIFEAFSESGIAVAGVYMGEKNHLGVKMTVTYYVKALLVIGVIFTAIFVGAAPYVPEAFGISLDSSIYEPAKQTSIIMGLSAILTALEYAPMNIYSCLGHPKAGTFYSICFNGVFPVALGIPLGIAFGYEGLVIGIALTPLATLIAGLLMMRIVYGKKGFPLYLGEQIYKPYMYCLNSRKQRSIQILDDLEKDLIENSISSEMAKSIKHFVNDVIMKIYDANGRSKVMVECSALIDDSSVRIILRDTGILFDVASSKELFESVSNYELRLETTENGDVDHLITTSTNRNGFVFSRG